MKTTRRQFLKSSAILAGAGTLGTFLNYSNILSAEPTKPITRNRKIYWWVGGGTRMVDTLAEEGVDGICTAGLKYSPELVKKNVYPLVFEHGPEKDDVINTMTNLKATYQMGWRQISTDIERRDYSLEDTKYFIDTIRSFPDLKIIQWNGYWNWKRSSWDLLEQCEEMVLAEMVYPLVSDENKNYDQTYAWIKKEMSHYRYFPEDRHAIALSTVCHGTHPVEPTPPLSWEKMKMQIDVAIEFGNSIHHPRQALAFYYPVPNELGRKIMRYIREKDNLKSVSYE